MPDPTATRPSNAVPDPPHRTGVVSPAGQRADARTAAAHRSTRPRRRRDVRPASMDRPTVARSRTPDRHRQPPPPTPTTVAPVAARGAGERSRPVDRRRRAARRVARVGPRGGLPDQGAHSPGAPTPCRRRPPERSVGAWLRGLWPTAGPGAWVRDQPSTVARDPLAPQRMGPRSQHNRTRIRIQLPIAARLHAGRQPPPDRSPPPNSGHDRPDMDHIRPRFATAAGRRPRRQRDERLVGLQHHGPQTERPPGRSFSPAQAHDELGAGTAPYGPDTPQVGHRAGGTGAPRPRNDRPCRRRANGCPTRRGTRPRAPHRTWGTTGPIRTTFAPSSPRRPGAASTAA